MRTLEQIHVASVIWISKMQFYRNITRSYFQPKMNAKKARIFLYWAEYYPEATVADILQNWCS